MRKHNKAIQTSLFYDRHWAAYPLELEGAQNDLQRLFPACIAGKRVLDAGSGSGINAIAFAKLGGNVLGVDASPECVRLGSKRAKKMHIPVRFERHDLTTLDLGDQTFDIIYSWGVLHHTVDAQGAFDRLVAHLKPGGTIVVAVYLKTWLSSFWNFSRIFYQNRPEFIKHFIQFSLSITLNLIDFFRKSFFGITPPTMRGTQNAELVNDWFGVPQRTFHSYDEVFGWFKKHGLDFELTNPATGRFKSTSNFEVVGRKPNGNG